MIIILIFIIRNKSKQILKNREENRAIERLTHRLTHKWENVSENLTVDDCHDCQICMEEFRDKDIVI